MNLNVHVRHESLADHEPIRQVNRAAFETTAEADLVDALRVGGFVEVSLLAEIDSRIVGHILFSHLPIVSGDATAEAVSLAPMAVLPSHQRRGIGSRLVETGLETCRERGQRIVVVLGHPEFYTRFGFSTELARPLRSPFSGPAWMALELVPGALDGVAGRVCYPPPFGLEPDTDGN